MKKEYAKWFINNWDKQGGLIRQKDAADLLGVSRQAIRSRIQSGSLPTYEYTDETGETHIFLGMKDLGLLSLSGK